MAKARKAQIMGQVFVMILAAAIFILILSYGYKAIAGFGKQSEMVAFIEFQTQIEGAVKSIRQDYGSVKKLELILPSKYTEICLVELEKDPHPDFEQIHPRMYDSWVSGTQNVFLTPMEDSPITTANIYVGLDGYLCLPIVGGKIELRLEGLGDMAGITQWQQG